MCRPGVDLLGIDGLLLSRAGVRPAAPGVCCEGLVLDGAPMDRRLPPATRWKPRGAVGAVGKATARDVGQHLDLVRRPFPVQARGFPAGRTWSAARAEEGRRLVPVVGVVRVGMAGDDQEVG